MATRDELIAAIEKADTKDKLEKIGRDELGVDVDKRKGVETIRADLLEAVDEQYPEGEQATEEQPAPSADDADAPTAPDADESAPSPEEAASDPVADAAAAADEADGSEQTGEATPHAPAEEVKPTATEDVPETGDTTEGPTMPPKDQGGPSREHTPRTEATPRRRKVDPVTDGSYDPADRILENVNNGRRFVWTPILATLPNMREV